MSTPLTMLALAFFAGVAAGTGFAATTEASLLVAVALAAGVVAGLGQRRALILVLAVTALFGLGLLRVPDPPTPAAVLADIGPDRSVEISGVVSADPQPRPPGQEVRLVVDKIAIGAERVSIQATILLRTPPGSRFSYGDRIQGQARLHRLLGGGRGAELDTYLAERGIEATGAFLDAELLSSGHGNDLRRAVSGARADLSDALGRSLDDPLAGLAQGIATGRRGTLDASLRNDLNATNLSHLVVI